MAWKVVGVNYSTVGKEIYDEIGRKLRRMPNKIMAKRLYQCSEPDVLSIGRSSNYVGYSIHVLIYVMAGTLVLLAYIIFV